MATNQEKISPETKEFLETSQRAWEDQDTKRALESLEKIESRSGIENLNEDWLRELKVRMQWVAFPALTEAEQLNLLANYLLIPLTSETFDLKKALRIKYLASPVNAWFESVPKILEAILRNEEPLGVQPILLKDNLKVKPTLGNWARDYVKIYGIDKQNEMAVRKYLSESANVQSLSSADKKILEKLLLIFESTKIFTIKQIMNEVEKIEGKNNQETQTLGINSQKQSAQHPQEQALGKPPVQNKPPVQQIKQAGPPKQTARQFPQPTAPKRPLRQNVPPSTQSRIFQPQNKQGGLNAQTVPGPNPNINQNQAQSPKGNQILGSEIPTKERLQPQVPQAQTSQPQAVEEKPRPQIEIRETEGNNARISNSNASQRETTFSQKPTKKEDVSQKSIREALKSNPQIANQIVTSKPIILMGRKENIDPTVQNWLIDYRSQFGAIKNTEDERREFLFRSANAKNLSSEERHKLEMLIESHDKETPLPIDNNKGIILFN